MDLQDFATACAWAQQAVEAKDWVEAQHRWALLRERFPAEGHPWWQQAVALREAGQTPQARDLLAAGAERFPQDANFAQDLARLAEGRGDWPEAERRWRAVLRLHADWWWAHTGVAHALVEQGHVADAEGVLRAAQESLPAAAPILLDYARLAGRRGDWAAAERRFRRLATRFPDHADALWGLLTAVREQGRREEAEQLLHQAADRHPQFGGFVHGLAQLAEDRRDWPEAERHWRAFLALEPQHWWAHSALARVLGEQDRIADAEQVLLDAQSATPHETAFAVDYARLAERRGDWSAAADRWAALRQHSPADWRGFVEGAAALRQLGQDEPADALLLTAADRFPQEPRPLHELARAAEMRRDWSAAEHWWRRLQDVDPGGWQAPVGVAGALCEQGDVAPAMAILSALAGRGGLEPLGLAMMAIVVSTHARSIADDWVQQLEHDLADAVLTPHAPPLAWIAYARLAKRREQFEESRVRLETAAARFPSDLGIWYDLASARELAPRADDAAQEHLAPRLVGGEIPWSDHPDQAADRALLLHFESLGGNLGGCEFGFHQRAYGFEPLSLLRWASIEPEQLCRLLEQQCEGLGRPDTVSLRSQGHDDWQAIELTYGMQMDHTHLDRKTVTIETATRLVCNSLKFLSRKLIDDLRLGEKVFVYRMSGTTVAPDLVARLQRAVASYGQARLLLVGEGTPSTLPIELHRVSPACLLVLREMIGTAASHAVRLASWQAICRAAAAEFGLSPG